MGNDSREGGLEAATSKNPWHQGGQKNEGGSLPIAMSLHRAERSPSSRRERTVIRAACDRAVPATMRGGETLGGWEPGTSREEQDDGERK